MIDNIKHIIDNIYKIVLPLPNNPLKEVNTYLIKGETSLLIDTAFDNDVCYKILVDSLKSLDVDFNKLKVVITHLHSDHSALSYRLKKLNNNIEIYASKEDAKIINDATKNTYWQKITDLYIDYGYPITPFIGKMRTHLGWEYHMNKTVEFKILDDLDTLKINDLEFKILKVSGHSPGHLVLYLKEKKILFCSDHILGNITPVIAPELNFTNPLKHYLESLKRIKEIDADLVLPGHRSIIKDKNKRIDELITHHEKRLKECKQAYLKNKNQSYYEIAKYVSWDLKTNNFENFNDLQKWFATGEVASHMIYLKESKQI